MPNLPLTGADVIIAGGGIGGAATALALTPAWAMNCSGPGIRPTTRTGTGCGATHLMAVVSEFSLVASHDREISHDQFDWRKSCHNFA